jgi:hypothetical protein
MKVISRGKLADLGNPIVSLPEKVITKEYLEMSPAEQEVPSLPQKIVLMRFTITSSPAQNGHLHFLLQQGPL